MLTACRLDCDALIKHMPALMPYMPELIESMASLFASGSFLTQSFFCM
jgi:hypothetical protein